MTSRKQFADFRGVRILISAVLFPSSFYTGIPLKHRWKSGWNSGTEVDPQDLVRGKERGPPGEGV